MGAPSLLTTFCMGVSPHRRALRICGQLLPAEAVEPKSRRTAGSSTPVGNRLTADNLLYKRTANIPEPVGTSSVRDIHSANNPHNVTASRIFTDQHQFRDQGKSQKSLDRQNPPMTIDQVRDQLNKNK